jgi:hypothetical protein
MPWFETLLAMLAVWRLARLLAHERGPADLVSRLHARLAGSAAGELLACPYCVGLWLALLPAVWLAPGWAMGLLLWWGIAGGAALIERICEGREP